MSLGDVSIEAGVPVLSDFALETLTRAKRAIALASGLVAKLAALKRGAETLAIHVRHGFDRPSDIIDALYEAALAHQELVDLGDPVILETITRGLETFSVDPPEEPPPSPKDYRIGKPSEQKASPKFVPIAIDDVRPSAEPAWLIRDILPARGLGCIIGAPKSRKSYLATDMMLHIARAAPYGGRAVLGGPVVYLTGEGVSGFRHRLIAMRRHAGIEGAGVPFFMVENVPDLGSERTDLDEMLRDLDVFLSNTNTMRPRVIVFDTLARCMGEGDENTAKDMGRVVARCGTIERHFECLVLLVHHTGKDVSKGSRGSNALNGAVDVTIAVEKAETHSTATVVEMKDGPEGQNWQIRLLPYAADDTPEGMTPCVVEMISEPSLGERLRPKTKGKVSPLGLKFLDALVNALTESTTMMIAGRRAAPKSAWKAEATRLGLIEPDEDKDTARNLFNKYRRELLAAGRIACQGDHCWLV